MKNYYEVGKVFQDYFDVIRVVEFKFDSSKCSKCEYDSKDGCSTKLTCTGGPRYDGKTVFYAKIDQLEEGEEFKEESYAK